MKKIKLLVVLLCTALGFIACSKDDLGMQPVFDSSNVNLEIKRDTADTYQISLPIESEEGLAKISLVDDVTGEILDEVTTFSDVYSYTYNYTLDLTSYTESTVLMLTLNIEDQEGQKVSKKITLTINFPVVEISFAGDNLQSQFEDYNLKVTIDKGVTMLQKVEVYLASELSGTLTLDPSLERQEVNVHVAGLEMGDNLLKVVVLDEFDQEFSKEVTIKRIEAKTWLDVAGVYYYTGNMIDFWGMQFEEEILLTFNNVSSYPEDESLRPVIPDGDKIYVCLFENVMGQSAIGFSFEYNTNDQIVKIKRDSMKIDDYGYSTLIESEEYEYFYDEFGDLEKVTKNDADYITNILVENGYIVSYRIDGLDYTPIYDENGERIDNYILNTTYTFSEELNPVYMSILPAVVPFTVYGWDLSYIFYNRYLASGLGDVTYEVGQLVDRKQEISWMNGDKELGLSIRYYE